MRRARDSNFSPARASISSSSMNGGVSARSPFVCMAASPSARSAASSTASTSRSAAEASASASMADPREDEALWALAQAARSRVLAAQQDHLASDPASLADWRPRRTSASEMVFDRRAPTGEYLVVASTTLPCSVAELAGVLSSDRSDDLNATLVALLGDAFSFAVTLRHVPDGGVYGVRGCPGRLSTKLLKLNGPIPLVSSDRTLEFLDYVERDPETRSSLRVVRSMRRDAEGKLTVAGDLVVGLRLVEKPAAQCTRVFYFGSAASPKAANGGGAVKRELSVQGLLKLAKLIPKLGAIAVRRRFGAQQAFADADAVDAAALGRDDTCAACSEALKKSALLKKRHPHACALCGLTMCGQCAPLHEVEERIGLVERQRICSECVTTLRLDAFHRDAASPPPARSLTLLDAETANAHGMATLSIS